jgi:alpha-1,6-mannosyltransferase
VLARRCGVPAGRALWVALAGPLVGGHLVGGPHNDALLVGAVVAALALVVAGARRPAVQIAAGVVLGAAVAIKVTALVVLPFAVLMAVERPLRRGPAVSAAVRLTGPVAGVMVAATAASGLGLGWIGAMAHTGSLIQFTSPPTAVGMTMTYAGRALVPGFDAVPAVRLIAVAALAVVLVVLWVRSARAAGDHVRAALHGAALACAAVIALAPVFHPWYLMLPLVLLAATTRRTGPVMVAAVAAALLVLPEGSGLAKYVKVPGAPLLAVLFVVLLVRHVRGRAAAASGDGERRAGDRGGRRDGEQHDAQPLQPAGVPHVRAVQRGQQDAGAGGHEAADQGDHDRVRKSAGRRAREVIRTSPIQP